MADRRGDGHEYRVTLGIFSLAGYFNGVVDALTDDFTVKFFISQVTIVLLFTVAIYEMAVMGTPRRPILASILLSLFGAMGYAGFWHVAWMMAWQLSRGPFPDVLWLAPNVYVKFWAYTYAAWAMFTSNIIYTVLVNASDRVKCIYLPRDIEYRWCSGGQA